ncbi:MAG: hypothetical protein ACR2LK_03705 [Solirubrobacteraceae bacterium]
MSERPATGDRRRRDRQAAAGRVPGAVRWSCGVAALGAALYLLAGPASADLAAQQYRAGLGLALWDNGWFAGHHLPGYSLLFPPLGALLGARVAGVLAALAAAALFALIAQRRWGASAATAAGVWFAIGATATLVSGRLTFLLGVAVGLAAVLALQRDRRATAALLALATALASPVAGLFLAIAVAAWALTNWPARGAWGTAIAGAALAPTLLLAVLFPEGGDEPFVASAFWPALAAIVAVAFVLPARERELRAAAAIYALGCVAAFLVATPLGGNVTRLGALLAGPVVLGALLSAPATRRRAAPLVVLALGLAYWSAYPAVRDAARASGDPSTAAVYHAPLIDFLKRQGPPGSFRVEIPFTDNHWEAAHVAPQIPLARGWERQLDRRYGELFYDGSLTASSYRAWLDEHAVAFVALPDVNLDYAGRDEARLIKNGLAYLSEVWRGEHWRVFAVSDPAPLAEGAVRSVTLTEDGFVIDARRAGSVMLRVRDTPWWAVTGGRACVRPAEPGTTRVTVKRPGVVRVQARLFGDICGR